ncbi:MAG: hypothetical protein KBC35_01515 [Candidatus Pacebacteria bacterium]|nr:hypothetical protein [Candidatus Paceibacterota bacterium]
MYLVIEKDYAWETCGIDTVYKSEVEVFHSNFECYYMEEGWHDNEVVIVVEEVYYNSKGYLLRGHVDLWWYPKGADPEEMDKGRSFNSCIYGDQDAYQWHRNYYPLDALYVENFPM